MSLHDVDKNTLDRGTPSPNRPDVVAADAVRAHKTISTQYKTDADTGAGRVQFSNKQIQVNDDSDARLLIGLLPDGTYGIAISKPGYDVITDCFS